MPRCEIGDKISASRLCAHYNFDLDKIVQNSCLTSVKIKITDKIDSLNLLKSKLSVHEQSINRFQANMLAFLIADLFYNSFNPNDQLLIASRKLKLSIKQIFQLCSPEGFYQLLIVGGNIFRNGNDISKVIMHAYIPYSLFHAR